MVKLGLNTWLFASYFKEEHLFCIDEAADFGSEAIDFCVNDPFSFPAEAVAKRMEKYAMEPVVTTAMQKHVNAISPDAAERDEALRFMKKLLDISYMIGAKVVGGVNWAGSGYHTGQPRTRQEIEWDAAYLTKAAEYAEKYGITIALEPVKRFESHFLNRACQALELIDIVGAPNVKVHLDTFHMNIEEDNLGDAIRFCGDKLAHMHLVDSNRGTPGMGHVPWTEVFEALRDIGYEGAGCIETFNPQTLSETASMTYLTRKFAETPEELAKQGLSFLRGIREEVYGDGKGAV